MIIIMINKNYDKWIVTSICNGKKRAFLQFFDALISFEYSDKDFKLGVVMCNSPK
jgi:hypothetical protein